MTRTQRITRTTALTLAALAGILMWASLLGLVHTYNGQNAGIVIGTSCTHSIGYEWKGDPGWFTDAC